MNKLIFISNSLADIEKAQNFAKKNGWIMEHHSTGEWSKKLKKQGSSHSKGKKRASAEEINLIPFPKPARTFQTMEVLKEEAIKKALLTTRGNVTKATELLGMGRATLYRHIDKFKIKPQSIRHKLAEKEQKSAWKKAA